MPTCLRRIALLFLGSWPGVLVSQMPTIRDSAGVRIIVSPSVSTAPVRFTLAEKPEIVIGGIRDDPADELNPKVSYPFALRLPGNRILASEQDHWGIYDARGKLLVRIGRDGAGPGEFRITQNGCRFRGDSLLLWDAGNRRISIWGPNGKLAREYTPTGFAFAGACLTDGRILVQGAHMATSSAEAPMATYAVVSTTGAVLATTVGLPAAFYSGSVWREMKVQGWQDHFYFGDEIALGMRVLDKAGRVTTILRTRDVPLPVTEANLSKYSMMCTPNRQTKECTPLPTKAKTWPAFYAFAVDASGRSWFRLNGGGSDSIWVGVGTTGSTVGKLLVPPDGRAYMRRIIEFGDGEVLLADYDADGARRVSIYRIIPVTNR